MKGEFYEKWQGGDIYVLKLCRYKLAAKILTI